MKRAVEGCCVFSLWMGLALGCSSESTGPSGQAAVQPPTGVNTGTVGSIDGQGQGQGQGTLLPAGPGNTIAGPSAVGGAAGTAISAPDQAGGGGTQGGGVAAPTSTTQSPAVENHSAWSSFGGGPHHTRSNLTETRVTRENAGELKPALDLDAPGVTATPAVYKGIIYWSDWGGIVHATDPVSQTDIWTADRSNQGGGYTGSPAVTERMVYVANRNGLLSALDRMTGETVWEEVLEAGSHIHIWSSPAVAEADDVLVVGVGGLGTRDNGIALPRSQLQTFRGWVEGRNATTGAHLWRFDTTPEPNGAGCSVWSSAALDTERKVAYIGVGNNYYDPVSDYSDSLLALNYLTGEYVWHAQFTEGDAWTVGTVFSGGVDGDVGAAPNLFTVDGRDVVGVGEKTGHYHLLDRETGAEIWDQRLTRGGFQGGVMAPAAVQDGIVYVVSNNDTASSTVFALDAAAGGNVLWVAQHADPTFGGPAVGNGVLFVGDTGGNLRGYNTETGAELWRQQLPGGSGAGLAFVGGWLLTGWGYHFSESRREPLRGGLVAFALGGQLMLEEGMQSDCNPNASLASNGTFSDVYQGILCPLGCTKVCHSTSAEAGLNLEGKMVAYNNLVNVAARGEPCIGKGTLVDPSSADQSLLYGKLTDSPQCGVPMPPGGGAGNSPVTPAMLAALRAWIEAGAPNN